MRIKPGGGYPFLQFPLSELHNRVIALEAIWGQFAAEIRERLAAAPTIEAGFALLDQLLLARLHDAPHSLDVVQYAIAEMVRKHGALSIRALSDQIGISQNQLGIWFKQMVGVTPKEFTRLIRFEGALRSITPSQPVDWTQIAHQCGFYDQSHFNKDFVAFTGHCPTDYLQRRRLAHSENGVPSQFLRNLPID
ncbi:MAG: helix-turn-helix domain-containing protein [Caldilineaceae bacterium]